MFDFSAAFGQYMDTATKSAMQADHTRSAGDLSAEVSGGPSAASAAGANASAPEDSKRVLSYAAGIVFAALLLLWLMGAIVLKGV